MSEVVATPLTPASPPRRGPDGVGVVAYLIFVLVGGLLVFGLARTLAPSAESHREAACRPLKPEPRFGPAPEITLETLSGEPRSLADYRGKFVVLNFWGTFCEPCIEEWPALDTLAQRLRSAGHDDVVVLAVSLDPEKSDIQPFLERMSLEASDVEVLWDPTQKGNAEFGSTLIPDTYFIAPDGDLEQAFINVRRWGRPDAYRCVDWSARNAAG